LFGVEFLLPKIPLDKLKSMTETEKSEAIAESLRDEEGDQYIKALIFLAFLVSPKGKEAIKTLQPFILKMLEMLERSMCSMFQGSASNPQMYIPATLLFTNIANRLYLIDGPTAMAVAAVTSGINVTKSIVDIIDEIAKVFKPVSLGESKTTALVYSLGAGITPYPLATVPVKE